MNTHNEIFVYPDFTWDWSFNKPRHHRYAVYKTELDEDSINRLVLDELGPIVYKFFNEEDEE